MTFCCIQDAVYNLHGYFYLHEYCGSCLKKKCDIKSCECDRHSYMPALIPLHVNEGCDCICKKQRK